MQARVWRSTAASLAAVMVAGCCVLVCAKARAQQRTGKDIVTEMLAQERYAADHKDHYMYMASERSDRTGGHMWTERIVETPQGRVRFLLSEDGQPLSPDRVAKERGRLAEDVAHPEAFAKREAAERDEEGNARRMLELLPHAFVLENARQESNDWRVDFRPDPNYSPSGIDERVLHGMSGWMLVDAKQMRLHHIEGRLPQDVSIGFGLLATVKAGSHFETTKGMAEGEWRTIRVVSDIRGKAALFKTIARNEDVTRWGFRRVENTLTVAQAVAMVEQ